MLYCPKMLPRVTCMFFMENQSDMLEFFKKHIAIVKKFTHSVKIRQTNNEREM